jgi:hypothetical protein
VTSAPFRVGTLIAAAHRAQADALEIEAQAKRRLADEYDAAQERGEVATGWPKTILGGNTSATVAEIGLSSNEIHDARVIRDAEAADRSRDCAPCPGRQT